MNTLKHAFSEAYSGLNKEQKQAVDTIDGPVMVVAGPGTGKTQVLSLRIANILEKTDTPPNGILCLTFTRAGVTAMRERLRGYVGTIASEIQVTTFHSFAHRLVEKHYELLDFTEVPMLLDDQSAVVLIDDLLDAGQWNYLRPRGNAARYFSDLKSLISLLKRERLTAEQFLAEIESEIAFIRESPDSISSRGATKGQLKKEVLKTLESLERTKEVVLFYEIYEKVKREKNLMDYDDVIEYAVQLAQESEDVCATLRESYLYIHVDEHQDSSGLQNAFLSAVWKEVERPNIFVVGDDRQLIYGFGGASLSYFEEFKTTFGKATLITLIQNYRSTEPILALADEMQKSIMTNEPLRSNRSEKDPVVLSEYEYPRDEIIAAAQYFKEQIENGVPAEEMALLVPKNKQVRSALLELKNQGVPAQSTISVSLFSIPETKMFRRLLAILCNPFVNEHVAATLFDAPARISPLVAHRFLYEYKAKDISVDTLAQVEGEIGDWGRRIHAWIEQKNAFELVQFVQLVGNEFLVEDAKDHDTLVRRVEVVRTLIELITSFVEKNENATLADFLIYLDRLEQYGQVVSVALVEGTKGVNVMTLHASKGLEYDVVWIAHMNEKTLMSSKKLGFTLPEKVQMLVSEKDEAVARREVYVAITRAKKYCVISYAKQTVAGGEDVLANVIAQIPESYFEKNTAEETSTALLAHGPEVYVAQSLLPQGDAASEIVSFVREKYTEINVSVTLLNTFFECPWRWYFRHILKLPEAKGESLYFGSAVHGAIEKSILVNKVLSVEEITQEVRNVLLKEGVSNERTITRLVSEAVPIVSHWMNEYLHTISPIRSIEKNIFYRDPHFAHLQCYGKIDLLEETEQGYVVTDFKTGSTKAKAAIEKRDEEGRLSNYERQLAMYAYLLKGTNPSVPVHTAKLFFVEAETEDKNKIYNKTDFTESIALLQKDIEAYDALVQSGEWIQRACSGGTFGSEECEHCKMAESIYGIQTVKK